MTKRRALWDWLPVGLLGVACWVLSSDWFRGGRTYKGLSKVAAASNYTVDSSTLHWLNWTLRKCGHFFGYALLALAFAHALRIAHFGKRMLAAGTCVLIWCAVDEYHQTWTRFREGSIHDVAVDIAGAVSALVALGVVELLRRWGRRRAGTS